MPALVSVVIPNLNSLVIDATLQALREQEFDLARFEVLVVGLDEPGLVRANGLVRKIPTDGPVPPAVARNRGVEEAEGAFICFTDADCAPHRRWLGNLLARYEDPEVTIVGGGVDFPTDQYWRLADNVATFHPYLSSSTPGTRDQLPSLNLSLRREVWEQVGPFDERYPHPTGEDADWTTRARLMGHELHFAPSAVVTHYPPRTTLHDLWRHAVRFGQYSVKVDERYRADLELPFVLRHWLLVLLTTPVMAGYATGRVLTNTNHWRYARVLPAVYIAKLAWCWGASKRLRGDVTWHSSPPSDRREEER